MAKEPLNPPLIPKLPTKPLLNQPAGAGQIYSIVAEGSNKLLPQLLDGTVVPPITVPKDVQPPPSQPAGAGQHPGSITAADIGFAGLTSADLALLLTQPKSPLPVPISQKTAEYLNSVTLQSGWHTALTDNSSMQPVKLYDVKSSIAETLQQDSSLFISSAHASSATGLLGEAYALGELIPSFELLAVTSGKYVFKKGIKMIPLVGTAVGATYLINSNDYTISNIARNLVPYADIAMDAYTYFTGKSDSAEQIKISNSSGKSQQPVAIGDPNDFTERTLSNSAVSNNELPMTQIPSNKPLSTPIPTKNFTPIPNEFDWQNRKTLTAESTHESSTVQGESFQPRPFLISPETRGYIEPYQSLRDISDQRHFLYKESQKHHESIPPMQSGVPEAIPFMKPTGISYKFSEKTPNIPQILLSEQEEDDYNKLSKQQQSKFERSKHADKTKSGVVDKKNEVKVVSQTPNQDDSESENEEKDKDDTKIKYKKSNYEKGDDIGVERFTQKGKYGRIHDTKSGQYLEPEHARHSGVGPHKGWWKLKDSSGKRIGTISKDGRWLGK